jgi:hypothetical protein
MYHQTLETLCLKCTDNIVALCTKGLGTYSGSYSFQDFELHSGLLTQDLKVVEN